MTPYLVSEAHSLYAPLKFSQQMLNYMVKKEDEKEEEEEEEEEEAAAAANGLLYSLFRTNISGVIWPRCGTNC